MTAIRAFIAKREKEIREQMRVLRSEIDELKAVRKSLEPSLIASEKPSSPAGPTIKEMVKTVLAAAPNGLAAQAILQEVEFQYQAKIERTSLSPQLSRLRQEGDVVLQEGLWFPSQSFLAGWNEVLTDDDFMDIIGPVVENNAATDQ